MRKVLFLTLMLFMTTTIMAQVDDDAKYATALVKPGTTAPDFTMKTIDGEVFQLSDLKGKYIVLDFWASWCPDCRKDAPNLVRMYNEFHKLGVEFVGVSFDTDAAAWKAGVAKYEIPYTQVSELRKFHDTAISRVYGVEWIPSMYLIGTDGKVILGTVMSAKLEKALSEAVK